MDAKVLKQVLVGALECASRDTTRPHLCTVQLESTGHSLIVRATDGACAVRSEVQCKLQTKLFDVTVDTTWIHKICKALPRRSVPVVVFRDYVGVNYVSDIQFPHSKQQAPRIDQVFPKNPSIPGDFVLRFDPKLLGKIAVVFRDVVPLPTIHTYASHWDPITVQCDDDGLKIDMVLMPFRQGAAVPKREGK